MKKVFVVFLFFAGLGGVAVWQWYESGTHERQVRYERDIAQVRERVTRNLATVAAQDENYSDEIQSWLSIYFRELAGVRARREYKDYPKFFSQDGMIKALEEKNEKSLIAEDKYNIQKEFYEFTKGVFDKMSMNDYSPELTVRKDSFRLDLFNIRKDELGGNPTLLADFAIWNYPGELAYGAWSSIVCLGPNTLTEGQKATEEFEAWKKEALEIVQSHIDEKVDFAKDEARVRREPYRAIESIHLDAFGGELKLHQKKDKLSVDEEAFFKDLCIKGGRRQVDADSTEPYRLVERPSRFVPDFPPGVVIGTYQLPLVPAHTKYMTMEMSFALRTPNGTPVELPLVIDQWKLDESWTMEPGRDWKDLKVAD